MIPIGLVEFADGPLTGLIAQKLLTHLMLYMDLQLFLVISNSFATVADRLPTELPTDLLTYA